MLASHAGDAGSNPVRGTAAQAALMPWSAEMRNEAEGGKNFVGMTGRMLNRHRDVA